MSTSLFTLESANMYCGLEPAPNSTSMHLKLSEVKLPHFEEFYIDHRPGGAPVAIEVDMIYTKLDCNFVIAGFDYHIYTSMRAWSISQNYFFIYGLLRDRLTSGYHQLRAILKGRLGNVEGQPWRRGDVYHTACSIRAITQYELTLIDPVKNTSVEIYNYNFDNNVLAIGTQGQTVPVSPV